MNECRFADLYEVETIGVLLSCLDSNCIRVNAMPIW